MASDNDSTDLDLVFSDAEAGDAPDSRRLLTRGALLAVSLVVVAGTLVYWVVGSRERQITDDLRQRSEILSSTRAEVLKTWLDSLGNAGQRLSRSDLFRLFAAEAGLSGALPNRESPLGAQVPYMIRAISEYARQESLMGAYLVDRQGRAILASGAAPSLTQEQRDAAVAVYVSRKRQVTPARVSGRGLTVDVMLPVAPLQEKNPSKPQSVAAVFVFTTPVQAALADIFRPSPLMGKAERTRLIQLSGKEPFELDPGSERKMLPRRWAAAPKAGENLPFALRVSVAGGKTVFSFGTWVPGMPWLVVHEGDAVQALASLREFTWGVIGFAVAVTLLLVAAFTAVWWRQANEHSQALADQYRSLGNRINAQRRFLENVMGALSEMVGLKGSDGSYVYANPSFAEVVGRSQDAVAGLDDSELFGRGTAQALEVSDAEARDARRPVIVEKVVHLPAGPRTLQFSKVPFLDDEGATTGILSVARDVTELREAEAKRQAAFHQMTRALVRTVETVDPFLAGHTLNVHEVSLALAEALGLGREETATIDITAMLAQIGKVSIPKEIVSKSGRLTPEEFEIMTSHIGNAVGILGGVDFGLPVVETLSQIHERLDGSGYPNGISGDGLSLPGRILGIADVFSARLEQRSYRAPITPEEAVSVLAEHPEKYDARVVGALKEFIDSIAGEKFLAHIRAT